MLLNKKTYLPYLLHVLIMGISISVAYFLFNPFKHNTGLKIGLINIQRVRDQSEPFSQWQKSLQEASAKAQERFRVLEEELVKEYELLQEDQQKKKLKPETLIARKQQLDKKALELEQQLQKERDELRQNFDRLIISIESTLDQIIQDYSKEHGIDLLLNTQIKDMYIALAGDMNLSHTEAIIAKLNEKIPSIKGLS
jgi:Skp family chaperone for outer membrane proteins